VDLNRSIEKLGEMAIDSYTTVAELNSEFNSLINKMEAESAQQLSDIIKVLREIAKEYKHLERQTRSAIRQIENVLSEVIIAASSKKLKPSQKIEQMKRDFSELANEFDELAKRHGHISQQLAMQAEKAETAKEENDLRVRKAEELKEHAQVCGILGTPGVGLISSVTACTMSAADSVDQPILKVLASAGGMLGGIVVGTVATVGSPILLTIAAVLAVKSKTWSTKFESMHETIRKLESIMNMASQCLSDINSDLNKLNHVTSQVNQNQDSKMLDYAFDRVKRSCEKVMESCTKYVGLADANTKNMKRIKKP
jgi:septal ring factor EnvC (AmiA/AmiB activator)